MGGGEIDALIIHPTGIVSCEVKHWFGKIVNFGNIVEFADGYRQTNPLHALYYKVKTLRTYLLEHFNLLRNVSILGCLVIDGLSAPIPNRAARDEFVFGPEEAITKIDQGKVVFQKDRSLVSLSQETILRIADFLCEEPARESIWRVGHFIIDREVAGTSFARQFAGRCEHVGGRDVLLRRWEMDPFANPRKKTSNLRRFEREAAALASLESYRTTLFPLLYDAFPDPSDWNVYWAVMELCSGEPLSRLRDKFKTNRTFREKVLLELDKALQIMKEACIVHRNLNENAIIICSDDRIVLTDFEFCSEADTKSVRKTIPTGRPVAPEVLQGRITPKTDIYDIATMIIRLIVDTKAEEPLKMLNGIKNKAIRSALFSALESAIDKRPDTLGKIRNVLKDAKI
jgi:serine/threonine protein kinase